MNEARGKQREMFYANILPEYNQLLWWTERDGDEDGGVEKYEVEGVNSFTSFGCNYLYK